MLASGLRVGGGRRGARRSCGRVPGHWWLRARFGATLPQHARLAYRIFSDGEGPLVLQPTSFGAVHTELEADASMLDEGASVKTPTVVAVNMLGNGVSFSPGGGATPTSFPSTITRACRRSSSSTLRRAATSADADSMGGMQALARAPAVSRRRGARHVRVRGGGLWVVRRRVPGGAACRVGPAGRGERSSGFRHGLRWVGCWLPILPKRGLTLGSRASRISQSSGRRRRFGARDDPDDLRAMVRTWRA